MLTVVVFFAILSVLVLVHEAGHFLTAKKAGVKVEEFGFGLPPRIWGKRIGETVYSLNWLPIGGFVRLYGEEDQEVEKVVKVVKVDKERAFWAKSKKARSVVIIAGVAMNFLLAVAAFFLIYLKLGIPVKTDKIIVVGVVENSPASAAGIKADDQIVSLDQQPVKSVDQFIELVDKKAGQSVAIEIARKQDNPCAGESGKKVLGGSSVEVGQEQTKPEYQCQSGNMILTVIPRAEPPANEGPMGVAISQIESQFFPWWQMPFLAMREALKEAYDWAGLIIGGVVMMLSKLISTGQLPKDIAGPVGIFQLSGVVARQGIYSILQFLGILSLNLAIINILPVPPMDGGRLLFIGAEAIFGRRYLPKIERYLQYVGMILVLLLLLLVTLNDLQRLFSPNRPF